MFEFNLSCSYAEFLLPKQGRHIDNQRGVANTDQGPSMIAGVSGK
jgi:hypothetical protein